MMHVEGMEKDGYVKVGKVGKGVIGNDHVYTQSMANIVRERTNQESIDKVTKEAVEEGISFARKVYAWVVGGLAGGLAVFYLSQFIR